MLLGDLLIRITTLFTSGQPPISTLPSLLMRAKAIVKPLKRIVWQVEMKHPK